MHPGIHSFVRSTSTSSSWCSSFSLLSTSPRLLWTFLRRRCRFSHPSVLLQRPSPALGMLLLLWHNLAPARSHWVSSVLVQRPTHSHTLGDVSAGVDQTLTHLMVSLFNLVPRTIHVLRAAAVCRLQRNQYDNEGGCLPATPSTSASAPIWESPFRNHFILFTFW